LFAWFGPAFEILRRHWRVLALAGGASIALAWLLSFARVSRPAFETRWWAQALDVAIELVTTSWLFAASYALLAQREGVPHGLGYIESWGSILKRAAALAALWLVVGMLLVIVAAGIAVGLSALAVDTNAPAGSALERFALLGATLLFLMLGALLIFAPFWVGLWIRYALSYARIVRSEEGAWTAFRTAWITVSAQRERHLVSSYAVVVALLVLFAAFGWFIGTFDTKGWLALTARIPMFATLLAFAFVIERTYDPSLGWEPDFVANAAPTADDADDSPGESNEREQTSRDTSAAPRPQASSALAARERPAASSATAPANPTAPVAAALGAPLDPAQLAAMVSKHNYSVRELRGLLGRCTDKRAALEALRPQLLRLAQGPRVAEAVILVEAALTLDVRFFAAEPDVVTPLAKRVATGGRADLAVKLLQPFVREHRGHKLHLSASLYAAHLVGQNLKKPAAARQFLEQLKAVYPTEPLIDQQLKRFETL
jgi:hypothetical protein